jgi:hydrogenase maturation protein HypF
VVQGVGFRPFIHNLALALGLKGFVLNSSRGVLIHAESSDPRRLDLFQERISRDLPPLARIEEMEASPTAPEGCEEFSIRQSLEEPGQYVLISPDIATCPACLAELRDPSDRRFGYPFVNCTNCGPRYTIIQDIPYDRPKTTMAVFPMCEPCRREYEDPRDRRFHAQPAACPACGPSLGFVLSVSASPGFTHLGKDGDPLSRAREMLRRGGVVAVRGLGGFHIACDATNHAAVARLREAKRRSNKPFAVMCRDLETVRGYAKPSQAEERILQGIRRPICLIPMREGTTGLSPLVAPDNRYLGVMLPYTPLHELLFRDGLKILVMTSGNWMEEPIIARNEEAVERLAPLVDGFLLHDREIFMRVDDSVVRAFGGKERVMRRARGFVPTPIDLGGPVPEILACGGELKHTFCLTKDRFAILSQHIGDLENVESMAFFEKTLENLRRLYRVDPGIIAHDLHPRYLSSQWAEEQVGAERMAVQHHHAHVVSCMAEHHLTGRVIGVAFDGTGYGQDGAVWGGEILVADRAGFRRAAHLRYVPLPGGEAAVREPWRMALAHLTAALGDDLDLEPWAEQVGEIQLRNVTRLVGTGLHSPPTSSMGRLFDAVSSMLGIRHRISFEGEAAMDLEMRSDPEAEGLYPYALEGEEPMIMDPTPMVAALWNDHRAGIPAATLGGRFHRSIAAMVGEVCDSLRRLEGLDRVCLSGGVFQNVLLLRLTQEELEKNGLAVYIHCQVPPNDGGISLGQAAVAGARATGGLL